MEESLLMEKSKAEESPWKKKINKKNKKQSKSEKERVPLCQVKKKIPMWKWLVLVELHAGV